MLSAELSLEKDAEKFARYVGEPSRGRVTIGNTRAQHAGHGASLTGTQQKADSQRWPARAQWDRQGRVEAVEQPLGRSEAWRFNFSPYRTLEYSKAGIWITRVGVLVSQTMRCNDSTVSGAKKRSPVLSETRAGTFSTNDEAPADFKCVNVLLARRNALRKHLCSW
ncbi:MAG: hypothetical protein AUI45_05750 [Acidobacteria bacterium 13_1_40CM_2_56_11]|nr:MAG: hypothetical protein AUI45_05750 [Acidobacteria bacterium 13_1_40CM_2_56_11]